MGEDRHRIWHYHLVDGYNRPLVKEDNRHLVEDYHLVEVEGELVYDMNGSNKYGNASKYVLMVTHRLRFGSAAA